MNLARKFDFDGLMESVVVRLLGEPPQKRGNEWRYGSRGSLSINLESGTWFDHEANEGGGVLDLIRRQGHERPEAWLQSEALGPRVVSASQPTPPKPLYGAKEYSYTDESGKLLYQVLRLEPKDFRQRRPDGNGGWIWSLGGTRRVLYRLPQLRPAIERAETIYIVEGEKDADAFDEFGLTATTNAGGANKWRPEYAETLRDADVVIIGDNDRAGRDHVTQVASSLRGVTRRVRVLDLAAVWPQCPPRGDISDWFAAGHAAAELETLTGDLPEWNPSQPVGAPHARLAADIFPIADVSSTWPEPLSLPEGLSRVENFDLEFIPPAIGPWVGDISERMQCPPEYIAVSAMVGLGSVLGRKIAIRPQRKTDWLEVANLWGCVVGRPGMMKSPAMMEALRPLYRLEKAAREAHGIEAARYAQELGLHQLRKGAVETIAKAALKKDVMASIEASPLPPEEPKERRYIANDVTYEKLGEILADNPNGVLAHRDELVSLLKTLDREEYAPARGFFLTAWSGTQGYTFDRVTRGQTHVEAACLSVLGSTQPGRLAEYVRRAVSGGGGDDGLIQRFGLLVWPDQTPTWRNVDRFPDGDAKQAAWQTFDSFDSLLPSEIGAEADDLQSLPFLRFDGDAQGLFLEWRSDLEARLRSADLLPAIEAHLAKYRKLVPALALIGHLAEGGTGAVGKAALMRALAFAEYLESHARRAYGAGPEAEVAAAKSILTHIRNNDLEHGFTARDISRRQWSHLTDRDQVQSGLNLLSDLDWIAIEPHPKPAGRPTSRYRINPRARQ